MSKKITSLLLTCVMLAGMLSVPALAQTAVKPVVVDITVYTARDKSKDIDLKTALTAGTAPITYDVKTTSHGNATRKAPAASDIWVYTPTAGFTGTAIITFTATNAEGTSNTGTVTINVVTPGPIARNSTINAVAGKTVTGMVDALEPEGLDMTFEIVSHPAKGTVTTPEAATAGAPAPGSFSYAANADATGTDSFTYRAISSAGIVSSVATVTVRFVSGNPTADNMTLHVVKNIPKEGRVVATDPYFPVTDLRFETVLLPRNGTLVTTGVPAGTDYTTSVDFTADGSFYYVPDKDYVGADSFTFRAKNPDGLLSNVATVTISVGVSKPTAENITVKVTRNGSVTGFLKGYNPATDSKTGLTYTVETMPQRGTITAFDPATGEFTYAPKKDRLGTDTIKYSVSNGTEKSDLGTVTVDIVPMAYSPIEYADMKAYADTKGHWAHESVGILGAMGMITGEEIQKLYYFRPDSHMNRSDFVLFLNSVMEIAPSKGATVSMFDDITESWLIPPLNAAKTAGVTAGSVVDGKVYFKPYGTLSRVEAVVFISNVLGLPNVDTPLTYTDTASIPTWAVQHMKNMSAYDILSGYPDGSFRPHATVTRAEAAVMLLKTYREKLLQMSRAADKAEGTPDWTGTDVLFTVK